MLRFDVTLTSPGPATTEHTLLWAIQQANADIQSLDEIWFSPNLQINIDNTSFQQGVPALIGPTRITGNNAILNGTPDLAGDRPEWGLHINETRTSGGTATFTISTLRITGFGAAGIYVQQLFGATSLDIVSNEVFSNDGLGIWSEAKSKTTIRGNNQIYDNGLAGIFINHTGGVSALGNAITGNSIHGNGDGGVRLVNASNFAISSNTFQNNGSGFAVSVSQTSTTQSVSIANSVSQNTFSVATGGIPIDLRFESGASSGSTPNDPSNDSDVGPNTLLNYPVIQSFLLSGTTWTVKGALDTDAANQAAEIQFYKYTAATSTYSYMSSITATLNGGGDWPGTPSEWQATFTKGSAIGQLKEGDQIAALAIITNAKNTSEMSPTSTAPSDIVVNSFAVDSADPHYLSVNYTINNATTLSPFRIGVYRSSDNARVLEYSPTTSERAIGTRPVRILVDGDFDSASDLPQDYTLIVRLDDNADQIPESIETNNEATFGGGIFQSPLGTVQVHGQPGATAIDTVTTTQTGTTLSVTLNGLTKTFTASGVPAIYIRTHGANDSITRTAVDAVMSAWGGDGDDALTIDGVTTMPTAVSKFDPGAGANTLSVNSGKVFLDTPWNAVSDPLWALATTVKGSAELQTNRLWQTTLTITESSTLTFTRDNSFENPASKLNSLTIDSGSTLDIADQALIIDYTGTSPLAAIRDLILSGRGGSGTNPTWTGTGITSSTAATLDRFKYSVAYAENSALPLGALAKFRDVAVDSTCILICYTRTADATLDGVVDNNDVTVINSYYDPSDPNPYWYFGDFDFDGYIENDDVTFLNAYYDPTALPA
jgi:parallel beta-helix repeat protein